MSRVWGTVGLVALVGAAGAAATAVSPQNSDEKSKAAFFRVCSDCHDADRIVSERRNRVQWEEVLDKMAMKGAQGSDEEFALVLTYLLRHYGRVNVNKAPPAEILAVLDLTTDEVDTIVKYRTEHGAFADFEALAKVPNIDTKKLDKNREAILF